MSLGEEIEKVSDDLLQNEFIKQALEISHESAYNRSELETYDKYWDYVRVEKTLRDEAYLTGLTKGTKEGIEKGIEKGILQVARNMIINNEPIDKIAKMTGLSTEQIEQLKIL